MDASALARRSSPVQRAAAAAGRPVDCTLRWPRGSGYCKRVPAQMRRPCSTATHRTPFGVVPSGLETGNPGATVAGASPVLHGTCGRARPCSQRRTSVAGVSPRPSELVTLHREASLAGRSFETALDHGHRQLASMHYADHPQAPHYAMLVCPMTLEEAHSPRNGNGLRSTPRQAEQAPCGRSSVLASL